MEISERAILTYQALQKRKMKREQQEKQLEADIKAVENNQYWRNYNIKYGDYYQHHRK